MRVLHVIETLDFGGAEKVVVDLVAATKGRCQPAVCCVKHSGELAQRLGDGVQVFSLGKGEGNDLTVPWRLARLVREQGFDVMHSHLWGVYLESALAAKLAGVPLVHTVHGNYQDYGQRFIPRLKLALRHRLERFAARWHQRIVTVSHSIQSYVVENIGIDARRVETVHNGIDERVSLQGERRGTTFITVGRMAAVKNHAMMIRAFARVAASRPDARLQLVGDGPDRPALEALAASLGVASRVEFLGFRNDVAELLAAADVFLMSSHYEGVSIAILEAMRAGLPVVGTQVGGIPETVLQGESGLLVPDGDEAAFADAMLTLLQDASRRGVLGRAATQRQREAFSLESAAQRYLQIYAGGLQ
ncbi:glycosyltransferase [Rhizobacter sp. P5_C2]